MKVKANLFSLSGNLDSLLAAFLGFFLIQLFCKHSGIGISPDSVTYLSSSRHLLAGHGFRSFDNMPTADFPFAYPFFLAVLSFITQMDPLQFGGVLNGILFGLLVYTSGGIMNGLQQTSGWYKRVILLCILMSPGLQEVYSLLWSETVFLLLILFFILCMSRYLRQPEMKWLLVAAGVTAIICITRYAGIFLLVTGSVLIFFGPRSSVKSVIRRVVIFVALSSSLFLVNIIRNQMMTGLAMGIRPRNNTGILAIMENFGAVLCDWILLDKTASRSVFLSIAVLLIFIFTIYFTFKKTRNSYRFEYILAVTGLIYCLFMLVTSAFTRYEQFTNRLLSPIFIPLLLCISLWIPVVIRQINNKLKGLVVLAVLYLAAWFIDIQLTADYEYYDGVKDAGVPGYREDTFVQTAIVQYLRKNKSALNPRIQIFSNAGDAVYFVTGLPARQLPYIDFPEQLQTYYSIPADEQKQYLIWFNNEENTEMPKLEEILRNKKMDLVTQLTDGSVFITH